MKKLYDIEKEYTEELKEIYGIENSINQIIDYIRNVAIAKKENFIKYNIVITNNSNYPNQTKDKLIKFIYQILVKYKIIKKGIEYIGEKTIENYIDINKGTKKNKTEKLNIENDLVVINNDDGFRHIEDYVKEIEELIKMYPNKVFVLIEQDNRYDKENFKTLLCSQIDWFFEVDRISETDKKEYITKYLEKEKIVINENSLKELSEEPFYMVKNVTNRIILNSKERSCFQVGKKDLEIYLEKSNKNKKQNRDNIIVKNNKINDLVGLGDIKKEINKITNYLKLCKKRNSPIPMLHMCFTGNPGTGKTTVARMVGDMLKEEGLLSGGDFVEVHARDLVGKYVGWTAKTVKEQVEKAKGGILFIDEAYSLNADRQGSFEDEAINTLIKEMEDNRDDLCVILAGYEEETMELIKRNPGFESRIQFYLDFKDYGNEDLYQIFKNLSKKEKYKLTSNLKGILTNIFEKYKIESNFSNARFVRNLYEKVKIEQANRVGHEDEEDFEVIKKCDVENVIEQMESKKYKVVNGQKCEIGFRV